MTKKVGYISPVDPSKDRMTWSGTFYNTFHAIKSAGVDVEWIPYKSPLLYKLFTRIASKIYKLVYGQGSSDHSRLMVCVHKHFINRNIVKKYDYIFIPGQSEIVAGLNCDIPIIYYSDATFKKMINYYWFDYSSKAIEEGNKVEKMAIEKAMFNFRASKWAAESTIKDYEGQESRVYVFPFGADVPSIVNLSVAPDYKKKKLKLLFSGKDWTRKGGDIAVKAVEYLNKNGINSELYIVGVNKVPANIEAKKFVNLVGYINKNDPEDYKRYLNLYHECNAFILPTRAECAGLVFAEANAFGMPIFTTDTGGIGDYVFNGENGYRLSLNANGEDFGKQIEKIYRERKFEELSLGSKRIYRDFTSWKAWSKHFKEFIEKNS